MMMMMMMMMMVVVVVVELVDPKIKVFLSDKLSVTNYLDTILWKPGIPGKDDTYHVNPINKIKVFFFNRIQYMSNLIPIKSSAQWPFYTSRNEAVLTREGFAQLRCWSDSSVPALRIAYQRL
ncbi:hypothetical protein BTVI_154154 [Pitangus sulphuratus]|nr:hypothetical protein BTVI_154154 [Pitangus sulphuratus]